MTRVQLAAQPQPASIDLDATALLVIDMQRDFLEPHGFGASLGNDVRLLRRAIAPIRQVLAAARARGLPVIHTQEGHRPDLSDCPPTKLERWPVGARIGDSGPMGRLLVRGEPGHQLIPELAPLPGEWVVDKPGKSAFHAAALEDLLQRRRIRYLLLTGVTTDVCCLATTIAANDRGFHVLVLADCVASYSPQRHDAALAIIQAQGGIFGWVTASHHVLAALGWSPKS